MQVSLVEASAGLLGAFDRALADYYQKGLKKMQIDKQTKRKTDEERLNDMGEEVRKHREEEHLKRKAELEKKLTEMKTLID